jgi:hypothetical protein
MRVPQNKKIWSEKEIHFIRDNFWNMTNQQLADKLGMKLTSLRTKCISMGLKRMELEYWTDEQIEFLKLNYQEKGDKEIAEIFGLLWPKNKGWRRKHIEKKRLYLSLKRTKEQRQGIREGHIRNGVYERGLVKTWDARGRTEEGMIHYWRLSGSHKFFPVIKINGTWIHWNRWAWQERHGEIPEGMNIVFADGDFTNLKVENLEMITNEELATRNSIHRYPSEIKSAIFLQASLKNKINKLSKKLTNEK